MLRLSSIATQARGLRPSDSAPGRRQLGRLALLSFLTLSGTLAAGSLARGDTVYLRDGRIVRGSVLERADGKIEITHRHGALVVEHADIIRIDAEDVAPAGSLARGSMKVDTVVTTDGRVLTGNVTVAEDTREIVVTNERFGGETRIPRDLVKSIRFRGGRPAAQGGLAPAAPTLDESTEQKWRAQIDAIVTKLRDPAGDHKDRLKARKELLELGIYATQYVKEAIAAVASEDTVVRPVLLDVLRMAEMKTAVAARIEEENPEICERLIDPDEEKRLAALKLVVLSDSEDAPPLLIHMIRHDPSQKVKALSVGLLAMLKRYEDLGTVLKMHDSGQLRFVAALQLGEAGIYAGVPVIIEALKLEGPQFKDVRTTAIDALKRYTGQGNLGYIPESNDASDRVAAVKRWEDWWQSEGIAFAKKSAGSVDRSSISDEDRAKALDRWREGNKALDEIAAREKDAEAKGKPLTPAELSQGYEVAAYQFKLALDLDPTLCSARIVRGLVLYEQLHRPREAESELNLVLTRFAPEDAKYPRLLATYHRARIAELESNWRRAESLYLDAGRIDDTFFDAYVGAGDCLFEHALSVPAQGGPQAGGAGGGDPTARPLEKNTLIPSGETSALNPGASAAPAPLAIDVAKDTREQLLLSSMNAYRKAIDSIKKRTDALKTSARDLVGASGEIEDFAGGRLMTTIRADRDDLSAREAAIWFRLGRLHTARGDMKEAIVSFRNARALDAKDPRYNQAVTFWENAREASK